MSKTHTLKTHTMNALNNTSVLIPNPDLLDLVKRYLPSQAGVPILYSISGSINFRIARLAGMIANALASDVRANHGGIDGWNDTMSYLSEMDAATEAFENAGLERQSMISSLIELFGYRITVNDYMAEATGMPARETNWAETMDLAATPRPPEKFMLEMRWQTYVRQCHTAGHEPIMSKQQYDDLSILELTKERESWAKHMATVLTIMEIAQGKAKETAFCNLDIRLQYSLLSKYGLLANDEQAVQDSVLKSKRPPKNFAEAEATIRLRMAFYAACERATQHHRYNGLRNDGLAPALKTVTAVDIATRTKADIDLGVHKDLIKESVALKTANELKAKLEAKKEPEVKTAPKVAAKRAHKQTVTSLNEVKDLLSADTPNDLP